jgi:hypothetical protein
MSKHELEFWVSRDSGDTYGDVWNAKPLRREYEDDSGGVFFIGAQDHCDDSDLESFCSLLEIDTDALVGDGECAKVTIRATVEVTK